MYYLPLLRNDLNVPLLITELISSRQILEDPVAGTPLNIGVASYLSEGLAAAIKRKKEITNPTIPFDEWSDHAFRAADTVSKQPTDAWRAIVLYTAFIQSKTLSGRRLKRCEQAFVRLVNTSMHLDNLGLVSPIIVLMLAKAQWSLSPEAIDHIDHGQALTRTLDLVYLSPDGLRRPLLDITNNLVVVQHWSGLSHVVRFTVARCQTFNETDDALNKIESFVNAVVRSWRQLPVEYSQTESMWTILKQLLFGVSLQLEGFGELLLHTQALAPPYYAAKILRILSPASFIVARIGAGGFDSYNFTYKICVDTLLEFKSRTHTYDKEVSTFVHYMSGSARLGSFYDEVDLAQLIYLLDLYESLLPVLDEKDIFGTVLPVTRLFLLPVGIPQDTKRLFESAHSVMLAYFSLPDAATRIANEDIRQYFTTALSLFPGPLSSKQLRLAINTIFAAVNNPTRNAPEFSDWLYEELFIKCKTVAPGMPIDEPADDSATSELSPPTLRAVAVSCLIHALPSLEPLKFQYWLPRVASLWQGPTYNEKVELEHRFLDADMRSMIASEADLSLSDIGIAWLDRYQQLAPLSRL